MSEKVNCPFCGNIVNTNDYKCPSCGSLFEDPNLPDIKFKEFGNFVALLILTFGLFGIIWVFINIKAINKLATNTKDSIKFNTLILISVLDILAYAFCLTSHSGINLVPFLAIIQCVIFMAITHRVIRIIQKYTQKHYEVSIEYNPFYIVFFNILYLIHFIDTYANRVLQIHEHFNPKSPQMILFIILLLILQFVICWNTNIHLFYKWLFSF